MSEELSQPTKRANKILPSIFLAMKATIFDIHGSNTSLSKDSHPMTQTPVHNKALSLSMNFCNWPGISFHS